MPFICFNLNVNVIIIQMFNGCFVWISKCKRETFCAVLTGTLNFLESNEHKVSFLLP